MCGINGVVSKRNIDKIEQRIRKMNASLAHRGPDADTYRIWENDRIAFGHRRLSVIDLDSRANQPFTSSTGRWILVYNGEIYNYKELKRQLSYSFKTESDTEALLAYIEQKGIEAFLKVCNGMFSFAVYDNHEHTVYLCRDRLGIKPLYYFLQEECLVFSSEIKGILNSGLVEAELDKEGIDDYFAYRYVREPYTFFQNIYQVEAGTYLKIDSLLQSKKIRYWEIPCQFNLSEKYCEKDIAEEFKTNLQKSVYARLIADVPLGTYLSGGVDSSLLSALAALKGKGKLNTYTIGFPEMNEFVYARLVAERYHTNHHEILMDWNSYQKEIKEVIGYKDAPLGVPNEIPLAVMSRELKKNITVVLSGEGADELLGGYGKIFRAPHDFVHVDKNCGNTYYQYFIKKYEYVPRDIRNRYLIGEHERRHRYDEELEKRFRESQNEYNTFYFFHKYHVKGLLQRVDTTTMLAGVEARVPFLDHKLIEYAYKEIPYEMKLHWNSKEEKSKAHSMNADQYSEKLDTPKYLLKKISYQYLPEEVIERKKVGFPVPLELWDNSLLEMAQIQLKECVWMKTELLGNFFEECAKRKNGYRMLWMFLNMEIFYQLYFTKEWRY